MAFVHPAFLFALTAVAIPVILHLVQLRRAKRIAFSNVQFIKASQDVTASQRKLKDLLILLCRVLFVVFLVLAFAQPFLPGTVKSSDAAADDITLLVDNSYSMQNRHAESDMPLLAYATDKATSILNLFPPASIFSVADFSSYKGNSYSSVSEVVNVLNNYNYSSSSSPEFKPAGSGHFFFLSDFQKNSFTPSFLQRFDSTSQVHLIPVEADITNNVYIDTVYLEDAFIRQGLENRLQIKVYNAGSSEVDDVPIKLFINHEQAAAFSLDLPAKQLTSYTIAFQVKQNEVNEAYVIVDDYPVEFDNTYHFILSPSESISITEVKDGGSLDLKSVFDKEALFRFNSYASQSIDYARASAADLLILNGVNTISAGLATTLNNYVKDGGTLLVVPPASGESQGYETLFQQVGVSARLAGKQAGSKTDLIAPASDNPFFAGVLEDYDTKLKMPAAVRQLTWSRASEDVLKYRGGAAFMSRFDRGRGHIFLMAAPLHEDYNTLVHHALLLPVMYKTAISSYKQEQQLAYRLSGETIKLPVKQTKGSEGIYKLEKDSLAFIPEQQLRGGNLYFTIPPDLNEAGFYRLTLDGNTVATIALNYNKQESELAQYSPDELRNLIGTGRSNIHVYDYGDALSVKNEFEKRFFGVELWKYCLILCLVFLMAEIALIRFL